MKLVELMTQSYHLIELNRTKPLALAQVLEPSTPYAKVTLMQRP